MKEKNTKIKIAQQIDQGVFQSEFRNTRRKQGVAFLWTYFQIS